MNVPCDEYPCALVLLCEATGVGLHYLSLECIREGAGDICGWVSMITISTTSKTSSSCRHLQSQLILSLALLYLVQLYATEKKTEIWAVRA